MSIPFAFLTPVYVNYEPKSEKASILTENKGKSGVYRWIYNVKDKTYIGSSANLTIRFNVYFNKNRLAKGSGSRMAINKAILKYGLNNFSLEIIEYCDKTCARSYAAVQLIEREQFYLDTLKSEYNILKIAARSH